MYSISSQVPIFPGLAEVEAERDTYRMMVQVLLGQLYLGIFLSQKSLIEADTVESHEGDSLFGVINETIGALSFDDRR